MIGEFNFFFKCLIADGTPTHREKKRGRQGEAHSTFT